MALPVISDIFRCTLNWSTGGGVTPRNVLHVSNASATEAQVGTSLKTVLENASYDVELWGCLNAANVLQSLDIIKLDGSSASITTTMTPGVVKGGAVTGDVIPQACGVVSFHTSQRGPRGRGRIYIGPIMETQQAGGILLGTTVTSMQTAWTNFLTSLAGAAVPIPLQVASYVHADAHAVTSASVDTIIGTQRRRLDQLR